MKYKDLLTQLQSLPEASLEKEMLFIHGYDASLVEVEITIEHNEYPTYKFRSPGGEYFYESVEPTEAEEDGGEEVLPAMYPILTIK